jgi:hypothetical protein
MNRDRKAFLVDRTRALAQGAIENLEIMWQDWAEDLTDEEMKLCAEEVERIAARVNKTRTFAAHGSMTNGSRFESE